MMLSPCRLVAFCTGVYRRDVLRGSYGGCCIVPVSIAINVSLDMGESHPCLNKLICHLSGGYERGS